jgi:hypothetical protein
MSRGVSDCITEGPGYVRVAFGSGNCAEICETYRSFADLCIGRPVSSALLEAGDNDPMGHTRLRDALEAMARAAAIPQDFKLALVPSTAAIHAIYREAQQALRAVGVNAWVFDSGSEAVEWLEGRSPCGQTAS